MSKSILFLKNLVFLEKLCIPCALFFCRKMPTASTALRPEVATSQRRSSLTKSVTPRKASITDTNSYAAKRRSSETETVSPRRGSLTSPRKVSSSSSKGLSEVNENVTTNRPRYLRRSSSSQLISKEDNGD